MNTTNYHHAVVIGGSMAGLTAAQALSKHFDRVTLIDRDKFPAGPEFRRGVPQSRHLHVLLEKGLVMLEQLFPGLHDELVEAGAVEIRWPRDVLWLTRAGWSTRFTAGRDLVCCSREFLEWFVRRRVFANENIRVLERHDATGLLGGASPGRVTGVTYRLRGGDAGLDEGTIEADLVVDTSGRNSKLPSWLETLGYPAPEVTTITSQLGYASRFYRADHKQADDWKVIYLQSGNGSTRGGGLFPMEDNRWIVTLVGMGTDQPPTDDAGFIEFARGIRTPVLYNAIKNAEPLTPIRGYQRTENRFCHYHKLKRLPDNLVALGDSVYAFNPVYGQGMTVAAVQAVELSRLLAEQRRRHRDGSLTGLSHNVQQMAARAGSAAWLVATGEDMRSPTTTGADAGPMTRLTHRYLDRVMSVAVVDPVVNDAFVSVLGLMNPPDRLFRPDVLFRALKGTRTSMPESPPARVPDREPELLPQLQR